MSEVQMVLKLDSAEARALVVMAQEDCRYPRDQVRALIRAEAERRHLWLDVPEIADRPAAELGRPAQEG